MPERLRKHNIGVMPSLFGLSFKFGVIIGIVVVASLIATLMLAVMSGAGWLSLLLFTLPIGLYVVFRTAGKKVKSGVAAVKTGVWLHGLETQVLQRKLEKRLKDV